MKKKFLIKGFPNVSQEIDIPDVAELLRLPNLINANAEDVMKYAPNVYKEILDKTPLKHNSKKVVINTTLQYLYPGIRTIPNYINTPNDEWHYDGINMLFLSEQYCTNHLLITECSAMTEFNINEFEIELNENIEKPEFTKITNDNIENWNLKGKKIPHNKFITFDTHLHKVTPPLKNEFRFFFRVIECDYFPTNSSDNIFGYNSHVYLPFTTKNEESILNIENKNNKIVIYLT